MNRVQAKKLVGTLSFIDAVLEHALHQVWDDETDANKRLEWIEEELESALNAMAGVRKNLPSVDPDFKAITVEDQREAFERGRVWSEQREEKIRLLRLAGDNTPEQEIPL